MATIAVIPTATPNPIPGSVIVERVVGVSFEEVELLMEWLSVMFAGEDGEDWSEGVG
jgi:hypothetical protein